VKTISLRQFRDSIGAHVIPVTVLRRVGDGTMETLGTWYPAGSEPRAALDESHFGTWKPSYEPVLPPAVADSLNATGGPPVIGEANKRYAAGLPGPLTVGGSGFGHSSPVPKPGKKAPRPR
jgi:hypothetical protein